MTLEEKDQFIGEHLTKLSAETLRFMVADLTSALAESQGRHYELIMAVGKKFPGETRHETALRYIQERENCDELPAKSAE